MSSGRTRSSPDFSFEEIERMYYYEHYGGHVEAQNARNEKTRHTERNRTVEDLPEKQQDLPGGKHLPDRHDGRIRPPDTLFSIVNEFYEEFERRFSSHIHILDWALHLDEGTPHIHERHVFDCEKPLRGNCAPSRKRRWKNLASPSPTRRSPKAGITTASRPLMRSAGRSCLTSPDGMGCIWIRSRPTAGGIIWKNRIIS